MNGKKIHAQRAKRHLDTKRERAAARAALAGGRPRVVQPYRWRRRPTQPPIP